jgi:hypothetical protein
VTRTPPEHADDEVESPNILIFHSNLLLALSGITFR